MKPMSIIGAIGDDLSGGQTLDQFTGRRHVVLLAGSDGETHRQAKSVYDGMKLGTEPAA